MREQRGETQLDHTLEKKLREGGGRQMKAAFVLGNKRNDIMSPHPTFPAHSSSTNHTPRAKN